MNNLIIIRVNGGLGNQLFQISNAYNLSLKFDRKLLICNKNQSNRGIYWDSIFSCFKDNLIDITEYTRLKSMAQLYNWANTRFEYKEINLNKDVNVYCIEGYYQSYKYIDIYTFKQKINYDNLLSNLKKRIIEPNDVALHIRRGDYTNNNIHKLLTLNYYKNCIDEINKIININKIYIFSDDMKWCKNELKGEKYLYIEDNDVNEMIFISKFNYIVIANSTFSWWSAFLSNNAKIYCPNDWFISNCKLITKDLRPKEWVIIDDNLKDTNNNVNEEQVDLINNIQLEEEVYFSYKDFNIISLGSACCMVQNIHDNIYNNLGPLYRQPDNATNFFDWVIVDFKSIIYVFNHLKNKDSSFLNKVNFTVQNIFTAPDKVPGGWSSKDRKVEHKDNKMVFLHDVEKELTEIPENFFEKYKRRFQRLYDKIINNTSLYLMHCFDFQWFDPYFPSIKEVNTLINICKEINKNCNVEIYFFIHPKYNNDNNKHLFAEYEVTNNLTICYLKNKGFNADWKANNLTWDSFLKKKD